MKNHIFFDDINDRIENIRMIIAESRTNNGFTTPIVYDTLLKEFQEAYLILLKNKNFFGMNVSPEPDVDVQEENQEITEEIFDSPGFKLDFHEDSPAAVVPEILPVPETEIPVVSLPEEKEVPVVLPEPLPEPVIEMQKTEIADEEITGGEVIPVQEQPVKVTEPAIAVNEKVKADPNISLADKFRTEDNSINQRFVSADNSLLNEISKLNPLTDMRQGIGINDRFMFVRELFANDSEKYNQTVEAINTAGTIEKALTITDRASEFFSWQQDNETVQKFILLVYRRYKQ